MTLALAVFSILLSVAAQFVLKAGVRAATLVQTTPELPARLFGMLLHPQVLAGLTCYAASAVVWLLVLAKWDVSKAYPLVGLGFVLTLPVGLLMGEQVGTMRMFGVVLIAIGVFFVSRT